MQGKKPPWFVCFVWNIFLPVFHKILMYMYIIDIFQIQLGKFNMLLLEWQKTFGKKKKLFNSIKLDIIMFNFEKHNWCALWYCFPTLMCALWFIFPHYWCVHYDILLLLWKAQLMCIMIFFFPVHEHKAHIKEIFLFYFFL